MIFPKIKQKQEDVSVHYDELDPFYLELWGEHLHHGYFETGYEDLKTAVLQLIDLIAKPLHLKPNMKILDVGCGYGATSEYLANKYKVNVNGITLSTSQYMSAISSKNKSAHTDFFLEDFLQNQFPDQTFDGLIAIESSEHMECKNKFFHEAHRILKDKGSIVIAAWLSKEHPNTIEKKFFLEPICEEGCLPSLLTASEYLAFLKQNGFTNLTYLDLSQNVKKTWKIAGERLFFSFLKNKKLRKFLFQKESKNKRFALSVYRIWLAYNFKVLQYGLFSATK